MTLDFNDAPSQREDGFELLPAGAVFKFHMTIRPGGVGEGGFLTQSKSSDAQFLDCDFAISSMPYRGRRIFQNFTMSGGSVDEKGRSKGGMISAAMLRAIINSARNIKPDDDSDQARAGRVLNGYADFTGMEFAGKVGIEKGRDGYADKNKISHIVEPGQKDYERVMAGESIVPGNSFGTQTTASAPTGAPSWANSAPTSSNSANEQPAQAQATAPTQSTGAIPSWAQ